MRCNITAPAKPQSFYFRLHSRSCTQGAKSARVNPRPGRLIRLFISSRARKRREIEAVFERVDRQSSSMLATSSSLCNCELPAAMNAASMFDSSMRLSGAASYQIEKPSRQVRRLVSIRVERSSASCPMYVSASDCVTHPCFTADGRSHTTPVVVLSRAQWKYCLSGRIRN